MKQSESAAPNTLSPVRLPPIRHLVAIVIMSVSVLSLGGLLAPSAAYAGTNGQHVYFSTLKQGPSCRGGTLTNVSIAGTNQDGKSVSWSGRSSDGATLLLGLGWWKGTVTIAYTQSGVQRRTTAWIPPWNDSAYQQRGGIDNHIVNPDVVEVGCFGSLWYGTKEYVTGEGHSPACFDRSGLNPSFHYLRRQGFTGYWADKGVNGTDGPAFIGGRFAWNQPYLVTGGYTRDVCGR